MTCLHKPLKNHFGKLTRLAYIIHQNFLFGISHPLGPSPLFQSHHSPTPIWSLLRCPTPLAPPPELLTAVVSKPLSLVLYYNPSHWFCVISVTQLSLFRQKKVATTAAFGGLLSSDTPTVRDSQSHDRLGRTDGFIGITLFWFLRLNRGLT